MTTLGKIPSSGLTRLSTVKCPPGLWITQVSGVTNPNGATGVEITCSNGVKSARYGAQQGNAFSFNDPAGLYVAGEASTRGNYVYRIGPNASQTFGPDGPTNPNVWANITCGDRQRLAGFNAYYDDAAIKYIQNPQCITPTVYVPPAPPAPVKQSCASGQVINKVTSCVDSTGKLIGARFGCTDYTYLPWIGKSAGCTAKLNTSTGYGDLRGLPMGPNVDSAAKTCPAGQAYNTVTIDPTTLHITPSACAAIPVNPPQLPVSYQQLYNCPAGTFVDKINTANSTTGLGMKFTCGSPPNITPPTRSSTDIMTSQWYGPKTGIVAQNTKDWGYDQVDYTVDSKLGVTSLTVNGQTLGSKIGASNHFGCPAGQIVTGVNSTWVPEQTKRISFLCSAPPYKPADIPIDITPIPLPAELPPTDPGPIVHDPTSAASTPPEPIPAPQPEPIAIPSYEPVPDYSVTVPTLNLQSSANTYILLMFFVILVAVAVFLAIRYRASRSAVQNQPNTEQKK